MSVRPPVGIAWVILFAALCRTSYAQQTSLPATTGIAADRLVPGVGPLTLVAGEAAEVTPFHQLSLALSLGYLADPIVLRNAFLGTELSRPVRGQLVNDVSIEIGVWKRLAVAVGAPLVLYATGDRLRGTGLDDRPLAAPVGGDLRFRVKGVLSGDPAQKGLHLGALFQVTVPLDGQSQFAATSGATVEPRLLADLRYGPVLVCAELGVRFADQRQFFLTTFGDELTWLGGISVEIFEKKGLRLAALAEAAGGVGPSPGTRPVELRGALRLGHAAWSLDAASGFGVVGDAGAPSWRVLALLRHSFDLLSP